MTWAFVNSVPTTQNNTTFTGLVTSSAITVAAGNLLIICVGINNGVTYTVTDSQSNTYTLAYNQPGSGANPQAVYYARAGSSGSITFSVDITSTSSGAGLGFTALAYSCTSGTVSVLTTGGSSAGGSGTFTTGALTWSGLAMLLATSGWNDNTVATGTFGAGPTQRVSAGNLSGYVAQGNLTGDILNTSSSPTTMSGTFSGGTPNYATAGVVFQSSGDAAPSFTCSPSTSTNAQSVTYTLTGSSTSWTGGTTFNISGITGASITSQSVNTGAQTASVTVLLDNTHTGTLTFADSTDSATATSAVTLAVPGAPTSPVCTPGNAQNVLTWGTPSSGGLTATYNVYRGTTPGGESPTALATLISGLTYTDTTAVNGTAYYYTIKAVNVTGIGVASAEVHGTPSASLTAGTASVVSVGGTIATVTVGNASGGTSPYTYQWYRSTTSGFTPGSGNIIPGATTQTYTDTGLIPGTTYYYVNQVTDSA
jgi:titin